MIREDVLRQCYYARTLPEIEAAWQARGLWLKEHPDDDAVVDVGEMLSKLEDALRGNSTSDELTPAIAKAP
jgi:hypothetical protein